MEPLSVERCHQPVSQFYWIRYHEDLAAYQGDQPPRERIVEVGSHNHGADPGRVFARALGREDDDAILLLDWRPV